MGFLVSSAPQTSGKWLVWILLSPQITTNRLNGLTTSFGGDSEDTHLSSTLGYRVARITPKGRQREPYTGTPRLILPNTIYRLGRRTSESIKICGSQCLIGAMKRRRLCTITWW